MRLPLVKPDLPEYQSVADRLREVIESGKVTNFGKYVQELEEACSKHLGASVATVSSGTMGLILTLQAAGLARGQAVVLPSFTFVASGQAILYAGGTPVFADVDTDLTLSVDDLDKILSARSDVGAILPVHCFGHPCRVDDLERVAIDYSRRVGREVPVIYDAAHAFGSAIGDRKVGGFGTAEVFSLSVTKPFTTVEGGLVSSRDPALIEKIRHMRNYGIGSNCHAVAPGLNGKMSELHAILGLATIDRVPKVMACRVEAARYFVEQIKARTSFDVVPQRGGVTSTYKDFGVMLPESLASKRPSLIKFLGSKQIETRTYFDPPLHAQSHFKGMCDRRLPNTDSVARRILTLPFFTTITRKEMDYMVESLRQWESNPV